MYLITAHTTDETAEAKIVFFDAAATMLIQTDCNMTTNELGFTDSSTLPTPLIELIGQTKIFEFHYTRFCKLSAIEFVEDVVFKDKVNTNNKTSIQPKFTKQPNTSSSLGKTPVATIATIDLPATSPFTPKKPLMNITCSNL
ncbi:hypothetical protein L1887_08669 [Cichorium endivia]|nr:hypothetical protein L1887_08669 [Cichorium endivia]